MAGRIVAVADTFDALTRRRPYRDAVAIPDAVAEIRSLAGRGFDPNVVTAFESLDHTALVGPLELPDPAE
jgi:putative two-component system response regulator